MRGKAMTDREVQESYTDHDGGEFSAVNVRVVATWPAPTFVENLAIDPAPFAELPAPPVGLAFDADGSLWATGGTFREGPGHIWKIAPDKFGPALDRSARRGLHER